MAGIDPRDAVIVIMAGGAGERFWPLSRPTVPKQLLRIHEGRTLLELAFERACRIVPRDRVYVAAGRHLRESILKALPEFEPENYVEEPLPRNTAACLGLAASVIECREGPNAVMGVLTADHLIEDLPVFIDTVTSALRHAAGSDDLVTIGMKPVRPETAFGYLELGDELPRSAEDQASLSLFRVERFTEKPPLEQAREFLQKGNYLWNSGMFFWKTATLFEAFESFQPGMMALWKSIRESGESFLSSTEFESRFEALPSLPIDTAVMEHAKNVAAVAGTFRWEDVGSWDALERVKEGDEQGNRLFGSCAAVDARDNIAYNDAGESADEEIVLFGVSDLVVVRSGKTFLVMPKSRAQDLKYLLKELRDAGRNSD